MPLITFINMDCGCIKNLKYKNNKWNYIAINYETQT